MSTTKEELKQIIREVIDTETDKNNDGLLLSEQGFLDAFKKGYKGGKEKQKRRGAARDRLQSLEMANEIINQVYDELDGKIEKSKTYLKGIQKFATATDDRSLENQKQIDELREAIKELAAAKDEDTDVPDVSKVDGVSQVGTKVGSYELEPEELKEIIRQEVSKIFKEGK